MTDLVFTTDRLQVRRWRTSDLEALCSVYGDADAMRWVGDGQALSQERCIEWLAVTRANYERRGYGMFAVEPKGGGEVLGFCGIVHPGGQAEPEVKYAYRRTCWGRGMATEALIGLLAYGHRVHGLAQMIATAAPAKAASHRVLIKAGLVRGALRANADGSHTQLFGWQATPGHAPGQGPAVRFTMALEDSEVAAVEAGAGVLRIRLAAAAARDDERGATGYLRSVEVVLRDARWSGNLGLCIGRVSGGRWMAGTTSPGRIPVPFACEGPVSLELQFRWGETLLAQGSGVTVGLSGPAVFRESYAC